LGIELAETNATSILSATPLEKLAPEISEAAVKGRIEI